MSFRALHIHLNELLFDLRHFVIEIVRSRQRLFRPWFVPEAFVQGLNLRSDVADLVDSLMQSRHGIIHLRCQSKLLLHGGLCAFGPWVNRQIQRCGLRFATDSKFDLVIAGQSQWPLRTSAKVKRAGYLYGIIVTQVPGKPVHSFVCWDCLYALDPIWPFRWLFGFFFFSAGKMPDDFALSVQNIERDFVFWCSLEIIIDDRARRRVVADWLTLVEFLRIMQTHCVLLLIKNHVFLGRLLPELTQCCNVVQHPEGTAMGRHDQIVTLYDEIVNR